jgi:O-antigen ligase
MKTIPHCVLFALLAFSMVGLAPFASHSDIDASEAAGGSAVRQIVLLGLCGALTPFVLNRLSYFRALLARERLLVLIVAWSGLSILWALAPDIAFRRWALAVVVIFLVASLCALINDTRRIHYIALVATGLVMSANYLVIVSMPEVGLETEVRGTYWTGIQPHKNGAGLVAAIAILVWLFAWRRFAPSWVMLGGAGLWLIFLVQTGSRTSQFALVMAIACTVMLSMDSQHLRRAAIFLVVSVLLIGVSMLLTGILPVESVLAAIFGETTFTGRTVLWSFLISQIHARPIQGIGFGSFWGVSAAGPINASEHDWFATTVQGHNGYLDITVTTGVVGLALCLLFLTGPVRSLAGEGSRVETRHRAFCAVWIFALFHNIAESSILRGDSILWIMTLISVIVLRSKSREALRDPVAKMRSAIHASLRRRPGLLGGRLPGSTRAT